MESRSCCCALLLLVLLCNVSASTSDAAGEHHRLRQEAASSNNNVEPHHRSHADLDSENKLMLECQHSDYRTYIKCLKREKRQQMHHGGGLEKRACLDECFEIKCNTSACLRDCHARCKRRLIETYSKTVETYDCADGSCSDSGQQHLPNITTNIHINNVLPNGTNCAGNGNGNGNGPGGHGGTGGSGGRGGPGQGGGPGGHGGSGGFGGNGTGADGNGGGGGGGGWGGNGNEPRININNVINNNGPGSSASNSDCPCPATGCNCYPFSPWQAMPQITIGFGPGPVGGCGFPMSWPCLQKYPTAPNVDCSMCSNPFLRYQCNPVCTPVEPPRRNGTVNPTPRPYPAPSNNSWNSGSRRY